MGCAVSKDPTNAQINNDLRDTKKNMSKQIKMLLLGTGESGKSTVAKQLKIIHMAGFSKEELLTFRPILHSNLLLAYKNIVQATADFGDYQSLISQPHLKEAVDFFLAVDPLHESAQKSSSVVGSTIATYVKQLNDCPAVQNTLTQYSRFQLPDAAYYLTEHVDRILSPDFVPTEQDVLRCRAKTTGIIETEFMLEGYTFKVVDVGGQRSERKKWIHVFAEVTALIFCVGMNEYDQKLYEDEKVNRMQEAVQLFEEVCNSEWFVKTDIILFLNKSDLFAEKIKRVDLNTCFPEYTGGMNYENGCHFIQEKFASLNKNKSKHIFSHVTCATDTKNIEVVFNATKSIILSKNLANSGFT